jgi:hypothetical protein
MNRRRGGVFRDQYGFVREGWEFAGIIAAVVAVVVAVALGILVFVAWPLSRAGCDQKGHEYGLPSHYKALSNICYVTLPNGRSINSDNLQVGQLEQVLGGKR